MKTPRALNRLTLYTGCVLVTSFLLILATEYFRIRVTTALSELSDAERLRLIAASCGKLCDPEANEMALDPSTQRRYRRVPMSRRRCRALYTNPYIFVPLPGRTPPRRIPPALRANFSMNGRIPIRERYFNDAYLGNASYTLHWNASFIEDYLTQVRAGRLSGTYGAHATNDLHRLLRRIGVRGQRVLVVGSQRPWAEAAALAAGARETVTLEYGRIRATHPRMRSYTPAAFALAYLADDLPPFDVVVAYSTYEHSGLGRYGDALNPWADLIAVAMAWCVAKPAALLVLEVARATSDVLVHNMGRYYADKRLPHLTTNWVRVFPDQQNAWHSHLAPIGDLARPMVFRRMGQAMEDG